MLELFEMESHPATILVTVGYYLDLRNADAFLAGCEAEVQAGKRNFVVDLYHTTSLDSTGLGAIFQLHKQLQPLGGRILFASPGGSVAEVLRLIRAEQVFPVYESLAEALDACRAEPVRDSV